MLRNINGNVWVQSFPECILLVAVLSLNLLIVSGQNQFFLLSVSVLIRIPRLYFQSGLSFSYCSKTCVTYSDPNGYFIECMS